MRRRKGQKPVLDHQRGMYGKNGTDPAPDIPSPEKRYGKPRMPPDFNEPTKDRRQLKAIWKEYIEDSPWLIRADTAMAVSYCLIWQKVLDALAAGKEPTLKTQRDLRSVCGELGFAPLARLQLRKVNQHKLPRNQGYIDGRLSKKERQARAAKDGRLITPSEINFDEYS